MRKFKPTKAQEDMIRIMKDKPVYVIGPARRTGLTAFYSILRKMGLI